MQNYGLYSQRPREKGTNPGMSASGVRHASRAASCAMSSSSFQTESCREANENFPFAVQPRPPSCFGRYNVERAFSFKAGKASFFDNWLKERRLANMPPRACVVKRRARRHVHKSPPQMQKALLSGTM